MKSKIEKRGFASAMKKTLSLLLSFVMLLSIIAGINLSAFAVTSGDYEYTVLKDRTAEITAYTGSATDISIPSEIDGYVVTNIGNKAFYENNGLVKVTIPNTVTSIGVNAFFSCENLADIVIPNSVMYIGEMAFSWCISLDNVVIPDSVTSIGDAVFMDCFALKNVTLPSRLLSLGASAFFGCRLLSDIKLPDSLTIIEGSTFSGCSALASITIPSNVKSIGAYAFASCQNLRDITIPKGVTSLEEGIFAYCELLENVNIPDNLINIENRAFEKCTNLKNITIPNSVAKIGDRAFKNCKNLRDIIIPESVISVGQNAFEECYDLGSITFLNKDTELHSPNIWRSVTIYGYCNSTALKYSRSNLNDFVLVEGVLDENHVWNSGEIYEKPTCVKNGIIWYFCTICGEKKTDWIPATGHKAVTDKAVAATCTKAGKTAGSHCSVCNTVIKAQQVVPATGHRYDAGKVTKAPTATTAGVKTYTCTKCKATKTETIKATGLKTPVLKAVVNANGTIKLSWGKVAEAEKYELYIKQADGSYKLMKTTTGTSFTTAFATYGKQFTYKMRAVAGNTKSAYSAVVNATNNKKLQTPTMKAAVNANGTFKLSWNAVTGATSYQLYIKQADGSYKLMKTTNATSFTTAFATYGKQFTYKMRAVTSKNSSATSAYSSAVNATNNKKLQTPTLKVAVNSNGTFKLSWNAVAGATSYQLYIKQADGSYKLMKTTNATSFTTATAAYGKQYTYKMRAVTSKNSSATSAYSAAVNAINNKKLQTPTLKVAVNANGTFKLSWNAVAGATSYQIYMKQSNGSYKLIKTTSSTSFTTAVAAKGKTYSYKVRAVTSKNKNATSNYSSVVNAKRK